MQNVTPRGWFVLGIASVLVVWGLVLVSACLWWVGIDFFNAQLFGWCWGSMSECVEL